jgi:hypothetical protein
MIFLIVHAFGHQAIGLLHHGLGFVIGVPVDDLPSHVLPQRDDTFLQDPDRARQGMVTPTS